MENVNRVTLDRLYERLTHRSFVRPDPLQFLYRYDRVEDREVVGLIAASLAYGNVKQIVASVEWVLGRLGSSPARRVDGLTVEALGRLFASFRHRWTTGAELAALLAGVRKARARYGTLEACFAAGHASDHRTTMPALQSFVAELGRQVGAPSSLLPWPRLGSACKRLHLYLRWMVREDRVDPGGWRSVSPARLVVPVDTHMQRIARAIGFTKRKQADEKTALEITAGFRLVARDDPVRYDFALTRLGIRNDTDMTSFLREYREGLPTVCA